MRVRINYLAVATCCVLLTQGTLESRAADSGSTATGATSQDATVAASTATGFRTKYAHFEPARFSDLPGWREDNLADAWKAFRASCSTLGGKPAWTATCARAAEVRIRNDEIRRFFEQEFVLYQIRNQDQSQAGVITGYYEPLLYGNRRRVGRYLYPVYGVPDDLLFLDSRSVPPPGTAGPVYARVDGKKVIPVPRNASANAATDGLLRLDVGGAKPDIRDKKLRVRIDGDRVVPYFTRSEIDQGAVDAGHAIMWVDNAAALYSMQVQGSGKVKLPDGSIMRVAYAEQNGHPFLPPVQGAARASANAAPIPQTRGIPLRTATVEDGSAGVDGDPQAAPTTRGLRSPALAPRNREPQDLSSEVANVVAILLKSTNAARATASPPAAKGNARLPPASASAKNAATIEPARTSSPERDPGPNAYSSDPSYVFFRQIPDNPSGPIGALGVPLTAGRSIAVDPRTTPLGFPVFVASSEPGATDALNRLMVAQDTGGAIRGAVRADYFWGFGPDAGERAGRMKQIGQMWVLFPKDQPISTRALEATTRGLNAGGQGAGEPDCVVPDPELCVE